MKTTSPQTPVPPCGIPALPGPGSSHTWSAYQLAFYDHVAKGTGHTILLARAGCAKTTSAVAALDYIKPGLKTLFVAFNTEIANELKKRVPNGVQASTIHSFGFMQIRRALGQVDVDKKRVKNYIILENILSKEDFNRTEWVASLVRTVGLAKGQLADSAKHIDSIMDDFEIDLNNAQADDEERAKDRTKFIAAVLSVLKHAANTSKHLPSCSFAKQPANQIPMFKDCRGCNPVANLVDFDDMIWLPIVKKLRIAQFDNVLIDEVQDLTPAQIELCLLACAYPDGRITAIGDDRQELYGFRGANKALQKLTKRLNAKVMPLPVTYRCAHSIVAVANEFVPDLQAAPNAPAGYVHSTAWNQMVKLAGPGDFILSRSNAPLIELCMSFLSQGRRATIQGKDLAGNLISTIKRSKAKTVDAFLVYLDKWEAAEKRRMLSRKPVAGDTGAIEDKATCLRTLCEGSDTLAEVTKRIETLFADDDNTSRIVLSTTHKAKGLERDRVFVLRGTYGKLDSEEAENLYYVAVTRARETLHVVADKPKASA